MLKDLQRACRAVAQDQCKQIKGKSDSKCKEMRAGSGLVAYRTDHFESEDPLCVVTITNADSLQVEWAQPPRALSVKLYFVKFCQVFSLLFEI